MPIRNIFRHMPFFQGAPFSSRIILIFILGFLVRLCACQNTFIINPDGALYIHQARAMYYGNWNDLLSCSLSYLSVYPFFIAGAFSIFQDWIIAARSVSLLFGTLTLIPSYLLLRRFLDDLTSGLATLVLALTPVFVFKSAEIVRGPIYWFFMVMGLYLFVCQIGGKKYAVRLLLSSLCLFVATWARIEAVLFMIVSCGYILVVEQGKRLRKLILFCTPMAIILFFALLALIAFDQPIAHSLRVGEIGSKFYAPIVEYGNLRADLAEWTGQLDPGNLKFFLEKARRLEWFIGFGVLLTYLIGAFFYPYFLIFLAGLGGLGKRIREDRRIQYLVALSFTALVMLYFHIIQTWVIADRFFAVFIFPAFVFLGFGVQRIQDFLEHRFRLKAVSAGLLLCLAIITVALPKDLSPREADKIVFKQIGEFIAKREGNNSAISVATATNAIRWVSFYANLNYPGSPCPQPYMDFSELMGYNYEEFLQGLKRGKVRYFLWAERQWPQAGFDFMKCMRPGDFVEIGEWSHPDTGKMILFSVSHKLE